jgi:hypothetical protein
MTYAEGTGILVEFLKENLKSNKVDKFFAFLESTEFYYLNNVKIKFDQKIVFLCRILQFKYFKLQFKKGHSIRR